MSRNKNDHPFITTCPLCNLSPVEIDDEGEERTFCTLCNQAGEEASYA